MITYKDNIFIIRLNPRSRRNTQRVNATYHWNQSSISSLPLRVAIHFHLVVRDYVPIPFFFFSSFPRRIPSVTWLLVVCRARTWCFSTLIILSCNFSASIAFMVPIGQRRDHSRQQEEERGCVAVFLSKGSFFLAARRGNTKIWRKRKDVSLPNIVEPIFFHALSCSTFILFDR